MMNMRWTPILITAAIAAIIVAACLAARLQMEMKGSAWNYGVLSDRIRVLSADGSELRAERDAMAGSLGAVSNDLVQCRKDLDQEKSTTEPLRRQLAGLSQKETGILAILENHERELADREHKISAMRNEIEELKKQKGALEEKISVMGTGPAAEIARLKAKIDELGKQLENAKKPVVINQLPVASNQVPVVSKQ